jgi:hypothetical protein
MAELTKKQPLGVGDAERIQTVVPQPHIHLQVTRAVMSLLTDGYYSLTAIAGMGRAGKIHLQCLNGRVDIQILYCIDPVAQESDIELPRSAKLVNLQRTNQPMQHSTQLHELLDCSGAHARRGCSGHTNRFRNRGDPHAHPCASYSQGTSGKETCASNLIAPRRLLAPFTRPFAPPRSHRAKLPLCRCSPRSLFAASHSRRPRSLRRYVETRAI